MGVYAGGTTREENEHDHEQLLGLAASGAIGGVATPVGFEDVPEVVERVGAGDAIGRYVVRVSGRQRR